MPEIVLIAAVSDNGVIGRDGEMPWRLSSDLKRFKADTMGRPVVMGRKTWQSVGRPLPGRLNIVITRDPAFHAEGAQAVSSLDEALILAGTECDNTGAKEVCVIGGGEIYAQAMPRADQLKITRVLAAIEGDTLFPAIDEAVWMRESAQDFPAGEKDSHATRYEVYRRRN